MPALGGSTRQPACCLLLSVLISAHLPRPISFPWCFASFLLVFLSGSIGNPSFPSSLSYYLSFRSCSILDSWTIDRTTDNMSKGHYHDMSAGTQNQGNKLGDRSCIRQSRLFESMKVEIASRTSSALVTSNGTPTRKRWTSHELHCIALHLFLLLLLLLLLLILLLLLNSLFLFLLLLHEQVCMKVIKCLIILVHQHQSPMGALREEEVHP